MPKRRYRAFCKTANGWFGSFVTRPNKRFLLEYTWLGYKWNSPCKLGTIRFKDVVVRKLFGDMNAAIAESNRLDRQVWGDSDNKLETTELANRGKPVFGRIKIYHCHIIDLENGDLPKKGNRVDWGQVEAMYPPERDKSEPLRFQD